MDSRHRHVRLRVDGYTQFCLTALVVLMTVMIVGLWTDAIPGAGPASAAGPTPPAVERYQPRSALDISELVAVQEKTNAKLDEIKKLLESGRVKVTIVGSLPAGTPAGETYEQPTSSQIDTGGIRPGIHAN